MGHFVSMTTAEKFKEKFEKEIMDAYRGVGINGKLELDENLLILRTDKDIVIILGEADEEMFWFHDKYNIHEERFKQFNNWECEFD